jgi:hypothetical protein
MRNEGDTVNCDSSRSAIDRRAVTAAGQLLMSAIWLEHRVRRVSTRLTLSSGQRPPAVSVVRSWVSHQSDCGPLVPDGVGATEPPPQQKKGTTNDSVRESRLRNQAGDRF